MQQKTLERGSNRARTNCRRTRAPNNRRSRRSRSVGREPYGGDGAGGSRREPLRDVRKEAGRRLEEADESPTDEGRHGVGRTKV